jgi:hypothetical protein
MNKVSENVTRKAAIAKLVMLPALAGALAVGATAIARADSRTALKYQSTPQGAQRCSGCTLFTPGKTVTDDGTCAVISGAISPSGWCTAFTARSKS